MPERNRPTPKIEKPIQLPRKGVIYRRKQLADGLTRRILDRIMPTEFVQQGNGFKRVEQFVQAKRGGVIFLYFHPSERESVDVCRFACESEDLRGLPVVAPMALHQYDKWYYRAMAEHFGLILKPVVTENTMEREKYKGRHKGEGLGEFIDSSIGVLREGGIVILQLTPGRYSTVSEGEMTLEFFMNRTDRNMFDDYLICLIGVDPLGIDVKEHKGVNLFHPYRMIYGDAYTKQEIRDNALHAELTPNGWVQNEMKLLVPEHLR